MESKWTKIYTTNNKIEIAASVSIFMSTIKTGDPSVENTRCVLQLENDPCIYMMPLLDYVDFRPEKKIVSLSTYQMVN